MFSPYAWNAPEFLTLYALLLAAAVIFGFIIPALLRPEGRDQKIDDPDVLAMLNGGPTRVAETAVARLLVARSIEIVSNNRFNRAASVGSSNAIDNGILCLPMPARWSDIGRSVAAACQPLARGMVDRGLLIAPEAVGRIRLFQTLPYLTLLVFGAVRLALGIERHRPVGFLIGLLAVTALLALIRAAAFDRRTGAAVRALREIKTNARRLATAPTGPEMGTAVALFGTAVLAGSWVEPFHRMRAASGESGSDGASSSGSDGGGSGCGGGGGGGGGCGGCGS